MRVQTPTTCTVLALLFATACGFKDAPGHADDDSVPDAGVDTPTGCAPGKEGAACILALYDEAKTCAAGPLAELRHELDLRTDLGPLWAAGRALFRSDAPIHVAGAWNGWDATAFATEAFCNTDLVIGVANIPTGHWQYKLVAGSTWSLDPHNPAFAFDDFAGNPDGRNSVLDTPDSGRGYLVELPRACSTALGNCRAVTAYLPPGYDASQRTYPVLFMHDGQNIFDDHDCCFGHTGWEINVALDAEIAAGRVAPVIVIGAASTSDRNNEYGLSLSRMSAFITFQITELQPMALAKVRGDGKRVFVAGSSLGGLVSVELALRHPEIYAGAAALSGAFWPNDNALAKELPQLGKQAVAIYLDHGGQPANNSDGAADSIEVRDTIVNLGWQRGNSPSCASGPDALCYYWEPNATHDELAWKARTWRFLRFLFPM